MKFETTNIGKNFSLCKDVSQIYRLKKNKRNRENKDNLEPDIGKQVYIRSHHSNIFYKIEITEHTIIPLLEKYIYQGLIYLKNE
jgi:hypothetical protein